MANFHPDATPVIVVNEQGQPVSSGGGGGGDASAANQVTGNASLSSIDTKTPTTGQKVSSGSSPVVIASDQSAIPVTLPSSGASSGVSLVSTNNSSTTNLGISATFTGTGDDVKDYSAVQVWVYSSHVSATNGLAIQQSIDNTNWRVTDTYTVAATSPTIISFAPAARYWRIAYTNGATATTTLEIQSILHYRMPMPSSQRPSDAASNENDFEQVQNFNMGFNGTTWDRLRSTTANGLAVDVTRVTGTVTTSGTTTATPVAGGSAISLVTAATTNATSVKATAGSLYEITISNVTAATIYVKFYNKASAPTVGTDVPIMTIPIAAGSTATTEYGPIGKRFTTGIAFATTAAAAATDTAVIAAGAQISGTYL